MKQVLVSLLVVSVTLFVSCATTSTVEQNPKTQQWLVEEQSIPEGKALVLLYRPTAFFYWPITFMVHANEKPIVPISNGGYYRYAADPGKTRFWGQTSTVDSIEVEIEAGQVYYIKCQVVGLTEVSHPKLTLMPKEKGRQGIINCSLIQ